MKYIWLDEYLMSKRGVTKDLQQEWNWVRYQIGGKMFAAVCMDQSNEPYYITLKLDPSEGDFLRQQYKDIIPGYYMNKTHWNSVNPDGEIPDDLLKSMLDNSYGLVLAGFSKKLQREILDLSCCGTECKKCGCYGSLCMGCNEVCGKVFHAPKGKACPIFACCVKKNKLVNCKECEQLPCDFWKATKDPSMTDEEFKQSIVQRVKNLKGID